jgi:glycerol-3-phosphate dehydrogenase
MTYFELFNPISKRDDTSYIDSFQQRGSILCELKKNRKFDLIVVGGGIHGACFARLAALHNVSVLLLEKDDYANSTSSRSSKLVHGGIRYLEQFDFEQVFEGIKAREDLFISAENIVFPYPFFIPILKKFSYSALKFRIGLLLYDLFLRNKKLKSRWDDLHNNIQMKSFFSKKIEGGFLYFDGLMNDTRLVFENIIAAINEGAQCLNYARVDSLVKRSDNVIALGFTDVLKNEKYVVEAGTVVNCAGPYAPFIGKVNRSFNEQGSFIKTRVSKKIKDKNVYSIVLSRGSHLVFDKEWKDPALLLPMKEKGRYYFVFPYMKKTIVGTTERKTEDYQSEPFPSEDEVNEIIDRIKADIPHAGLNTETLVSYYAGVRNIPYKINRNEKHKSDISTSALSRKHVWSFDEVTGMLTLLGGKYTTASWTVFEGFKIFWSLAERKETFSAINERKLPGAVSKNDKDLYIRNLLHRGVSEKTSELLLLRYGGRVRYFFEDDSMLKEHPEHVIQGEIDLAFKVEQACTLEDLLIRRLELHYSRDGGLEFIKSAKQYLQQYIEETNLSNQVTKYQKRIEERNALLKKCF